MTQRPAQRADVLMINPPWVSKDENIWNGVKSAMPPLGLLSVAAYAEQAGFQVQVMDVHIEKFSAATVRARIVAARPRVIGLSVMTATANAAHQIARIAKEAVPDVVVVMGGVHPEAVPAETLCNAAVDAVVRGDGERPFLEICQGHPLSEVAGVSWRDGHTVVHNPGAPVERDLDSLPMPAYHLVPMGKYYPAIGAYQRLPAINMVMTRGCPGRCAFCNSANTTLRTRSAEQVFAEIELLHARYGIRELQFYDDTFTIHKQNVLRFCELMSASKLPITWAAFVRADCFNDKMAKAMKAAGCHQILIGVESADEEVLRLLGKPIHKKRNAQTIALAKKYNIDARVSFIFGNRGETVQSMRRTLDYALELDPEIAMFNICTPYPGTQLFRWAKDNGYLNSEEWSDYELSTFLMDLPTLSTEDLLKSYRHAYRRFYLRPSAVRRRLSRIRQPSHIRDLVSASAFIVLRHKLGRRGEVREDWIGTRKEDFYDFEISGDAPAQLTWEVRQSQGTHLQPSTLVPRQS
jgi:radical SAM superfamily enzyme YgiQ (UPF0313 family)